jgi:uncharacterized protein (UPF0335 family)
MRDDSDDCTVTMQIPGEDPVEFTEALKANRGRSKRDVPGLTSNADRVDAMGTASREKLRQFVARIERLQAEKDELTADIRDVYAEVKSFGFDTKVMRKLISLRKQDANERAEQEALLDLYQGALDD